MYITHYVPLVRRIATVERIKKANILTTAIIQHQFYNAYIQYSYTNISFHLFTAIVRLKSIQLDLSFITYYPRRLLCMSNTHVCCQFSRFHALAMLCRDSGDSSVNGGGAVVSCQVSRIHTIMSWFMSRFCRDNDNGDINSGYIISRVFSRFHALHVAFLRGVPDDGDNINGRDKAMLTTTMILELFSNVYRFTCDLKCSLLKSSSGKTPTVSTTVTQDKRLQVTALL